MQYFQSRLPVLILDSNFIVLELSDSALALLQVSREDITGSSILSLLEENSVSSLSIPQDISLSFRTNCGERRNVDALLIALHSTKTQKKYALFLSPEVKISSDLSIGSEIQNSKLQALGTLAGGIAHDLNNLLMAILGHLSFIRLSNSVTNDDSLRSAEEGARMAAKLSQQILDFARRQQVSLDTIDICQAVTSAIPLLSPSLPDYIDISFRAIHSPLFVSLDESQITQIVLNLVVNARDAMHQKGKIRIEVDRVSYRSRASINGFTITQGEYARIVVVDEGHGMSDDIKNQIFEPFFTTKRGTGTGLGLATVFFLVKSLRGAIDVYSEPDKGTTFSVLIPLAGTNSKTDESKVKPSVFNEIFPTKIEFEKNVSVDSRDSFSKTKTQEKILVVDDEDAVRMVLQKSLELLGYDVVVAENGEEALSLFKVSHASIVLVVMDMIMPHMPGHVLFYELQKINPEVRVLISSGYSSDGKTQQLLSSGAKGFIQKPFAIEELAQEVERCLKL
jgi:signal transduction histidine kinase/CheY-like chemotaxis protein